MVSSASSRLTQSAAANDDPKPYQRNAIEYFMKHGVDPFSIYQILQREGKEGLRNYLQALSDMKPETIQMVKQDLGNVIPSDSFPVMITSPLTGFCVPTKKGCKFYQREGHFINHAINKHSQYMPTESRGIHCCDQDYIHPKEYCKHIWNCHRPHAPADEGLSAASSAATLHLGQGTPLHKTARPSSIPTLSVSHGQGYDDLTQSNRALIPTHTSHALQAPRITPTISTPLSISRDPSCWPSSYDATFPDSNMQAPAQMPVAGPPFRAREHNAESPVEPSADYQGFMYSHLHFPSDHNY